MKAPTATVSVVTGAGSALHVMRRIAIILSTLALVAACHSDEVDNVVPDPNSGRVIAFVYQMEEESAIQQGRGSHDMRRNAPTGLQHDFKVWGYKTMPSDEVQRVFSGYNVTYHPGTANTSESNTHDYEYVGGAQTIKYWDFGASAYRFWGATGGTFSTDGTSLSISALSLATTEPTTPLYSALYLRQPVAADVVRLKFKRPYAKVRLQFYTTDELTGSEAMPLSDITFGGGTGSIVSQGAMTVNYPYDGAAETITVSPQAYQNSLSFSPITLDATHGTASNNAVQAPPIGGTDWYYILPLSTAAVATAFTLSVNIDGDTKTATVPAAFMHWNPNTCYTYIFKITEGGKKIETYEVLVDPWLYGGSQEEEWKNW